MDQWSIFCTFLSNNTMMQRTADENAACLGSVYVGSVKDLISQKQKD